MDKQNRQTWTRRPTTHGPAQGGAANRPGQTGLDKDNISCFGNKRRTAGGHKHRVCKRGTRTGGQQEDKRRTHNWRRTGGQHLDGGFRGAARDVNPNSKLFG